MSTELLTFPEAELNPRQRRIARVFMLLSTQLGRDPTPEEMLDHMMRRDWVMDEAVRVAIAKWQQGLDYWHTKQ